MLKHNINKRIDELHWSIETVAKQTGLHRQVVSKLRRGENANPKLRTLEKLAAGLGMRWDELLCTVNECEKNER